MHTQYAQYIQYTHTHTVCRSWRCAARTRVPLTVPCLGRSHKGLSLSLSFSPFASLGCFVGLNTSTVSLSSRSPPFRALPSPHTCNPVWDGRGGRSVSHLTAHKPSFQPLVSFHVSRKPYQRPARALCMQHGRTGRGPISHPVVRQLPKILAYLLHYSEKRRCRIPQYTVYTG